MMRIINGLLLFTLFCCSSRPQKVCDRLVLSGEHIAFSDSEKKLLCGDPSNPAWNQIPRQQVSFHLKTFLLERGYFDPQVNDENEIMQVTLGPRVDIERIEVENWPPDTQAFHERRFRGLPMKPESLDEIEIGVATQLKSQGFPCAEVTSEAYPFDKKIKLLIAPGGKHFFGPPEVVPAEDLDARTLKRYEAFTPHELYNYRLLELSERRIRDSGLVQDVTYFPECNGEEFVITHRTISGRSRLFSAGAGFDTEQLAIAKLSISLNRLSKKGSSLKSEAFGSLRTQSLSTHAQFHLWPPESRTHLYTSFTVEHRNEKKYDTLRIAFKPGIGASLERRTGILDFKMGPNGEFIKIYRGVGKENTRNIGFEFSSIITSHNFEYFAASPQRGYRVGLFFESSAKALGATFGASKANLFAESLWTLFENYQLDLILGLRGYLNATYSHEGKNSEKEIPPSFKTFMGGSHDMRGFAREELPGGGIGAMSAAYFGTELRLARAIPLEPFIFADLGALAQDSLKFEAPYYVSPGIGLRWQLPFGTLRGTAAYGWSFADKSGPHIAHPQFFISFGEEF